MPKQIRERVHFRVIQMPCCNHILCWVNPRLPTFCPECGSSVIRGIQVQRENIKLSDKTAWLSFTQEGESVINKLFKT
jgi:hypothetical protein